MLATVSELYSRRGLELKRKGHSSKRGPEWAGPCPGCQGKDRFLVWPEQNDGSGSYSCRGCGKAGDVIQFLRDFDGLSFHEARKAAGMDLPAVPRSYPKPTRTEKDPGISAADPVEASERWREKATNFARKCHEALLQDASRLGWLAGRGLPLEAVKTFLLGWNKGDGSKGCLWRPRQVWGLPEVLNDKGEPKKLWLPRGLVIPMLGADGSAHRLRIRRPQEDRDRFDANMKFYVVPGSGMSPLWIAQQGNTLPPASCSVVVESELDAMALAHHAGDICSVLGLMTAKIRSLPTQVLYGLKACARILVATDVDEADQHGRRAGAQGWELWRDSFSQARRWPCVRGKDPGEMFSAGADVLSWILAGLPDALVEMARAKVAGRAKAEASVIAPLPPLRDLSALPPLEEWTPPAVQHPGLPDYLAEEEVPPSVLKLWHLWKSVPGYMFIKRDDGGYAFRWNEKWASSESNWNWMGKLQDAILLDWDVWRWLWEENPHSNITFNNLLHIRPGARVSLRSANSAERPDDVASDQEYSQPSYCKAAVEA